MTGESELGSASVAVVDLPGVVDAAHRVVGHLSGHTSIPTWYVVRLHHDSGWVLASAGEAQAGALPDARDVAVRSSEFLARGSEATVIVDPHRSVTAVGVPIHDRDGAAFGVLCGLSRGPVPDRSDPVLEQVAVHADLLGSIVTYERAASEAEVRRAELAEIVLRDELTGLLNRSGWNRMLEGETARVRRHGYGFTVAVIDMDGLKLTNDRLGHAAGDQKLVSLADGLVAISRTGDSVARLGGDEFALYAAETAAGAAPKIVDRIRTELDRRGVGASIGAVDSGDAPDPVEAWRLADFAMYADKRARRDR